MNSLLWRQSEANAPDSSSISPDTSWLAAARLQTDLPHSISGWDDYDCLPPMPLLLRCCSFQQLRYVAIHAGQVTSRTDAEHIQIPLQGRLK